jgi:hypothetical protein
MRGLVLRSLLAASGSFLILKPLPSIKIWYAFSVLSTKKNILVLSVFGVGRKILFFVFNLLRETGLVVKTPW